MQTRRQQVWEKEGRDSTDEGKKIREFVALKKILENLEKETNDKYQVLVNTFLEQLLSVLKPTQRDLLQKIAPEQLYPRISLKLGEQEPKNLCIARTITGQQCSKARKDGSLLCGTHIESNPYGVIGETNPQKQKKPRDHFAKKIVRGIKGVDLSRYLRTTEIEIKNNEGELSRYLIDQHGVLYDYFTFTIRARIVENKIYWYI